MSTHLLRSEDGSADHGREDGGGEVVAGIPDLHPTAAERTTANELATPKAKPETNKAPNNPSVQRSPSRLTRLARPGDPDIRQPTPQDLRARALRPRIRAREKPGCTNAPSQIPFRYRRRCRAAVRATFLESKRFTGRAWALAGCLPAREIRRVAESNCLVVDVTRKRTCGYAARARSQHNRILRLCGSESRVLPPLNALLSTRIPALLSHSFRSLIQKHSRR